MRLFSRRPSRDPRRLQPGWYSRENVARDYEKRRFSGFLGRLRHRKDLREVRRALDRLGVHGPLLDLPCGTGRLLPELGRYGFVAGADASLPMLRIARRRVDVSLVQAEARRLPFPDSSFAAVLSLRFLIHVRGEERRDVLREMARVSGRYVIADLRHRYSLRFLLLTLRFRFGLRRHGKIRLSGREIREVFLNAGLRVVEIRYFWPWLSEKCLVVSERIQSS